MALECIICGRPSDTGMCFVEGTPEHVAAALILIGVPREIAEKKAAEEQGDMLVTLCDTCADISAHYFPNSKSFSDISLKDL